jgi:hypothetical protein
MRRSWAPAASFRNACSKCSWTTDRRQPVAAAITKATARWSASGARGPKPIRARDATFATLAVYMQRDNPRIIVPPANMIVVSSTGSRVKVHGRVATRSSSQADGALLVGAQIRTHRPQTKGFD